MGYSDEKTPLNRQIDKQGLVFQERITKPHKYTYTWVCIAVEFLRRAYGYMRGQL